MQKAEYKLTHNTISHLIQIEVTKALLAETEVTGQTRANLQLKSKAVNMFHMAHMLGVDLTLKDAEKAAEGKQIKTEDIRGTVLNNFRNALEFIQSNVTDDYMDIDSNIMIHLNKIMLTDWKESWEAKVRTTTDGYDQTFDDWAMLGSPDFQADVELRSLLDQYKSSISTEHFLVRLAVLMFGLVRIIPFVTANKFTLILTATFLLNKNKYLEYSFLPMTRHFDIYGEEYAKLWVYATETGDLSKWIEAFLRNLANDMGGVKVEIEKRVSEENKGNKQPFLDLNKRQLKILRYLQTIPTVKREDYVQMMEVSTMTAFRDLDELCNKKLIRSDGKGRATRYMLSSR